MRWCDFRTGATILVAALTVATGCQAAEDREEPTLTDPEPQVIPREEDDSLQVETIVIEGMEQRIRVLPYHAPVEFPKNFSTVVPEDMVVDYASSGEGDAVRFEAAFGGVRRPDALLSFTLLPEGTTLDDARILVGDLARQAGGARATNLPWAVEEWRVQPAGFIALAEHNERWFYFLAQYPAEFGDGMVPRIDLILRRWVFTSDQTPLVAAPSP
jgi:hypothetical protein